MAEELALDERRAFEEARDRVTELLLDYKAEHGLEEYEDNYRFKARVFAWKSQAQEHRDTEDLEDIVEEAEEELA